MSDVSEQTTVRAAVYCRISSDPEGHRAGVKMQEADCRDLCERRGWELAGTAYVDNDMSAYSGKPRPEYLRLLDDVKNGMVDAVVAWHPDRLHRSPRELEDFIDLVENTEVRVATVQSGDYDLATSSGRMNARIVGSVARKEAEATSERTRRAHQELAKEGKDSGGGYRAFGFHGGCCPADECTSPVEHADTRRRVDVGDDESCCAGGCSRSEVREDEAAVLREVADRLLAGASLSGLARELNGRNVRTVTGAAWAPRVLRRMVRSARVAGLRVHRGEIVGEAAWPAIIERDTWARLRRLLGDPARKHAKPARSYLLAGMVRCSRCGATMRAKPARGGRRNYHCGRRPDVGGCGRRDAVAEPLEEWVAEAALSALEGEGFGEVVAAEVGDDRESAAAVAINELAEVEERMEVLRSDHYVDGVLGREEFLKVHGQLEGKREQVRRRVAEATGRRRFGQIPDGTDLREWWESATFDRRRAVMCELVDHVTVGDPVVVGRSTFDPRRVSITWRT